MKEKVNNILGKIKEILKKIFDRKWKIVVFIVFILLIIGGILIYQTKWVRDMNAFVNMLEDKDYNCKGEKIGNPFFIDDYRCVLKEDGIKKTVKWYLDNRSWWENIISGEYQEYYEKMYNNR